MRHTLVTISVAGPTPEGWVWEVDGPGGMHGRYAPTEAEAWAAARAAAVTVLGRLEAPLGGHTLAAAIEEAGT